MNNVKTCVHGVWNCKQQVLPLAGRKQAPWLFCCPPLLRKLQAKTEYKRRNNKTRASAWLKENDRSSIIPFCISFRVFRILLINAANGIVSVYFLSARL
jgi:hypothetical protein